MKKIGKMQKSSPKLQVLTATQLAQTTGGGGGPKQIDSNTNWLTGGPQNIDSNTNW
jgi:hypothetical protein